MVPLARLGATLASEKLDQRPFEQEMRKDRHSQCDDDDDGPSEKSGRQYLMDDRNHQTMQEIKGVG
ncbi:hypothetical protein D3C80_1641720 [compost metagenome]